MTRFHEGFPRTGHAGTRNWRTAISDAMNFMRARVRSGSHPAAGARFYTSHEALARLRAGLYRVEFETSGGLLRDIGPMIWIGDRTASSIRQSNISAASRIPIRIEMRPSLKGDELLRRIECSPTTSRTADLTPLRLGKRSAIICAQLDPRRAAGRSGGGSGRAIRCTATHTSTSGTRPVRSTASCRR